jgi:hypothetical protein
MEQHRSMNPQSRVWKSCNGRTYKKEREKIYVQRSDGKWDLVATGFSPDDYEKRLKKVWQSPEPPVP